MASFIKIMKKYAINKSVSNEDFTRELFTPYITSGNIKDKNGELLELNKARVSRLLSQKDDVPAVMRNALSLLNIADKTAAGFSDFLSDNIDPCKHDELIADICKLTGFVFIENKNRDDFSRFLTEVFIEAVKAKNISAGNADTVIWHLGSNSIEITEGDLFKFGFENRSNTKKNIVSIPVNTAFDTYVSTNVETNYYPLVSENTLHGKWINRWVKSGRTIAELDKQIEESLNFQGEIPNGKAKAKNGKQNCYEIGTTAIVSTERAFFYLVALASFDEHNRAQTTVEWIKAAILKLLDLYDKYGQGYSLYIPLFGTGRSRSGIDYQESFYLIRQTLLENKNRIQGHIVIVVKPDAFREIKL